MMWGYEVREKGLQRWQSYNAHVKGLVNLITFCHLFSHILFQMTSGSPPPETFWPAASRNDQNHSSAADAEHVRARWGIIKWACSIWHRTVWQEWFLEGEKDSRRRKGPVAKSGSRYINYIILFLSGHFLPWLLRGQVLEQLYRERRGQWWHTI
jgi:hypothetical protein